MTHYRTHKWIFYLLIILFLAACSDSNNSAVNLPGGDVMQGVAVDPYIEGAVFQEIDADTGAVLQESSPSNALGVFVFPDPLTPGSIIELKDTEKGLHGGAPYLGMLRRVIAAADQDPVVVSPLTTLLANGITPEELIAALHDAGLTSLTTSDLYADPMVRLSNITAEVTDQDLALLQASMAVNAYMEITGVFEAGLSEMNDPAHLAIFDTMLNIIVNLLNTGEFETITAALANDPDVTTPLIPEDFVHAAMAELRTIIALAQEGMANNNGTFDPVIIMQAEQDALQNCVENVKSSYSQRVPASTVHDGALLYHDNCAACHQPLDVTEKPGRTAADIQNAIDNNLGYMGFLSTLTEGEVQAIAEVLPAPPVVDPGTPPDGTALYSSNCAGCHNPLDTTNKPGRTAAQIQAAIDGNVGNMGYLSTLTQEEVQAIAEVLPPSTGGDPGPDYSDCTACHGQPPATGAHDVHTALGLGSTSPSCNACHDGATHNSQVDLFFPAGFDAESGPATDNGDGTCSSVKCHGGQTTPDWWSGSIVVDTQCTACHASGSSQYNSYSSGEHSRHVSRYDCTVCHNIDTLQGGHFSDLETSIFELDPADTIGGGTTRVGSYNNGTCSSVQCHGNENW